MNLLHCLRLSSSSSSSDCVFVSHLCCAAKGQLKSCVLLQRPKQTLTVQAHVIIEIITGVPFTLQDSKAGTSSPVHQVHTAFF